MSVHHIDAHRTFVPDDAPAAANEGQFAPRSEAKGAPAESDFFPWTLPHLAMVALGVGVIVGLIFGQLGQLQ